MRRIATEEDARNGPELFATNASWNHASESCHFVQFYENDLFLVDAVSAYIEAGLLANENAVVIGTTQHRRAIEQKLEAQGLDIRSLQATDRYLSLDAAETLSKFMVDGAPVENLFTEYVGTLLARMTRGGSRVRLFGEMVSLLWGEGNQIATIRLEELWNNLSKTHAFSLFCGYPLKGFSGSSHSDALAHICKEHSWVIPTENYTSQKDSSDRLRFIVLLQQKAGSLELESGERKHAESSMREKQTKLTMAVAIAQLGIWEFDLNTLSLTCCEQCKIHLGLAPDEPLTYEGFWDALHPDDREKAQRELQAAITTGDAYASECRVVTTGGQIRWIALMGRCFHNGAHRMLGVMRDITQQRHDARILEQTVAKRTAQLRENISELQAFSYSISHDMRAPLRSIHSYADILMRKCGDKIDSECWTYLQRIASSAERMDRLIQDILALSKVSRAGLKLEPVNLDHLLHDILETYPNLKSPQAQISIEGSLPWVMGNTAALTQCLSNLLGNAVKFVTPGLQAQVRLWADVIEAAPGQSPTIRLYIQDNGIGIPKEAHEKIFGIFHRLSKKYEGTGIGLAIVKKAMERMGGKIFIESEPGRGSIFRLELKSAELSRKTPDLLRDDP